MYVRKCNGVSLCTQLTTAYVFFPLYACVTDGCHPWSFHGRVYRCRQRVDGASQLDIAWWCSEARFRWVETFQRRWVAEAMTIIKLDVKPCHVCGCCDELMPAPNSICFDMYLSSLCALSLYACIRVTCLCTVVCVWMWVCNMYIHIRVYIRICVCMYTSIHVCVFMYTFV